MLSNLNIEINKLFLKSNETLIININEQLKDFNLYYINDYIYISNIFNFILCKKINNDKDIYFVLLNNNYKYIECIINKNIIEWDNIKNKPLYYCKINYNQETYILYYDNKINNFILNKKDLNILKKKY